MTYIAGNLFALVNAPPGRGLYRYDTTDELDTVDDGGYFHNSDDNLNLAKGDLIHAIHWDTAIDTGTIGLYKLFIVTFVNANGSINISEVGVDSGGAISSGDV